MYICMYIYIYIFIYIYIYIYSYKRTDDGHLDMGITTSQVSDSCSETLFVVVVVVVCVCVCVSVCVCVCVCLRPSTVKASSVWISWDTKEQINDVMLKTLDSFYFGMQNLTFQLATLSCSYTRSEHSHDLTNIRLALRT